MKEINARLNRLAKIANFLGSLTPNEFAIVQYAVRARTEKQEKTKHKKKRGSYHCDKISDKTVRKVIELRAQGVSFKEAAKVSGVKYGTINSAYFRRRVETLLAKIPADDRKKTC